MMSNSSSIPSPCSAQRFGLEYVHEDGKRHQPLESELVKFRYVLRRIATIDFVDQDQRPVSRRPQLRGDVAILGQNPGGAVDHEKDEVGGLERAPGLIPDLARKGRHRRVAVLESAGISELVTLSAVERNDVGEPVAGHPRHVMREGAALTGQPVEERRLADIRPSDDDNFPEIGGH